MLKNACLCLFLLKLKAAADSSVFFSLFYLLSVLSSFRKNIAFP